MTLKELRAQHVPPLTQQQLAAAVGVTLRCVQAWESGARSIDRADLETLCTVAHVLGCRLHDLIQSPVLLVKLREVTQNDNG
jgi:DNA-binding XRE family transcriptional regulator